MKLTKMVSYWRCDRCNNEITEDHWSMSMIRGNHEHSIDLCDDCVRDLKIWITPELKDVNSKTEVVEDITKNEGNETTKDDTKSLYNPFKGFRVTTDTPVKNGTIGKLHKAFREKNGFSQHYVAELIGMKANVLSNLENEQVFTIRQDTCDKLNAFYRWLEK